MIDNIQAASSAPADSTVYLLSYQNGRRIEKTMQIPIMSYQCLAKSGLICVGGDQGSYIDPQSMQDIAYGSYEIIKLTDSFETVGKVLWDRVYDSNGRFLNGTFEINGSSASEQEMLQYIQSFGFDPSSFTFDFKNLYISHEKKNKASIIELYQALERGGKS